MGWVTRDDHMCLVDEDNDNEVWRRTIYLGGRGTAMRTFHRIEELFMDKENPTEEEVALFEVDTGCKFPPISMYKKFMKMGYRK